MHTITCLNNRGEEVTLPKEKFFKRPSVYAILRNKDQILVCHNKTNSKLALPGGGIEAGEDHKIALKRELLEETGIVDIQINQLVHQIQNYFYYEPEDLAMDAEIYFYECSTDTYEVLPDDQIDDEEAYGFEWMTIQEAVEYGFMDSIHDIIVIALGKISV